MKTSDLKKIIEYFPDAVLIINDQLIVIEANEDAKNIFCATGNQLIGISLQELITAINDDFIKNQLQQNLLSLNTYEFSGLRLNGSGFPANLKFKYFKDSDVTICAVRDLTGFTDIGKNLLSDIVICSDDAIVSKDLNGKILSWNAGAEKLFQYTASEAIGKPLNIVIPTDKLDEEKIILNHVKENKSQHIETRRMRKDGSLVYVSLTVSPVKNIKEQIVGAANIARNITERVEMVNRLIQQNKKFEDFTQILTHNLRAPLNNLHALLDLYKLEKTNEGKKVYISKFEHSVNNLNETINHLIEIIDVRYDAEQIPVSVKFNEVFDKIKSACESDIIQLHAEVISDFSGLEEITYMPEFIESIMLNLLTNALKYNSPERKPVINFKTQQKHGKCMLAVSDNGLGIDLKKYGSKLFGFHSTFHKHPKARGVGLHITKAQIEAMGGSISVDSEVNEGTTFKIIFN